MHHSSRAAAIVLDLLGLDVNGGMGVLFIPWLLGITWVLGLLLRVARLLRVSVLLRWHSVSSRLLSLRWLHVLWMRLMWLLVFCVGSILGGLSWNLLVLILICHFINYKYPE